MNTDLPDYRLSETLRRMEWERAKGSLYAILNTPYDYNNGCSYQPFKEAVYRFIREIETRDLLKGKLKP